MLNNILMIIIGILIGIIFFANSISFEDKCFLSGGQIEGGVCILNK